MGRELGRISGPLLSDNLLRNGTNLAFETKLLYFDVVNKRVGINFSSPTNDLFIHSTTNTVNLNVTTSASLGSNIDVSTNQIQNVISSITISPNQSSNPNIITPGLSTANLYLYSNTISDTVTNDSIYITANGTGAINLNNDTTITGNLHATGNITWDGNITLGSNSGDTIDFAAEIKSDIIPSANLTDNLGSSSLQWNNLYINDAIGNFTLPDFTIAGNSIAGTVVNSNVNITANGSGTTNIEYLSWANNNITNVWPSSSNNTQNSIIFYPNGSGNIQINSTTSLILPIGDDATRSLSINGEIRYNDLNNNIEAYSNTGYVNLIDLYSQDHQTYITGELAPGVADNTLRFGVAGTVTTTITDTTLQTNQLASGNVAVTANTIKNNTLNADLQVLANGNGLVEFASALTLSNSSNFNNLTGSTFQFNSTGYGSFKFTGSNGLVIPVTETTVGPVQGTVRYNPTSETGEIYSNTYGWMPWVGATNSTITSSQGSDLSVIYTLMLGF